MKLHLQESNRKYSFPVQALKVVFHAASVLARISVFAFVHVFKHLSAYAPIKIWIHMLYWQTNLWNSCMFFLLLLAMREFFRMIRVNSSFYNRSTLLQHPQNKSTKYVFIEITPSLKVTLKTLHLERLYDSFYFHANFKSKHIKYLFPAVPHHCSEIYSFILITLSLDYALDSINFT